ncbi:plasmid maintenance protein CcdB [Niveispirillum lacus]|uniref:Toxin CcdB n=1 Tax=Niveispirillum lacus TaxID=1981099 RepID=A0A255Z6P0_9PROT|nr:CcdB family protein [Niveispirillum lacus]OYQ37138.1 plasmid maintenance protein CcdB [Niveispirillum lacus]
MARFDVHVLPGPRSFYLLDVQANLLDRLETRVVVPLFPEKEAPPPIAGLNPVFDIQGQRHVMVTQSIATLRRRDLGKIIQSLDDQHQRITKALDMLLTGF